MDRIEGSSTARAATWNDDEYDKPLPGVAQKSAANIANAPWLSDAAPGTNGVPGAYPAAIFSNPAMYGPAVSLAKPPALAAPKPEPLAAAPNSLKGITLANVAAKLPTGTRTDSTRAFSCGAGYKLYPEVAKQPDGKDAIVYWTAFNRETKRTEFVVGPDALRTFTSAPRDYATAAANGFMGGDEVTRESVKAVDEAMRHGFAAGVGQALHASHVAWTNPDWIVKTVTNTSATFVQSVAVADRLKVDMRAVAAERAVGEVGSTSFLEHVNNDLPLGKTEGTRAMNCANCAVATDAAISGSPASALPGAKTSAADLSAHYGTRWSPACSANEIENALKTAGEGTRGIVFGEVPNRSYGHFFNVVNDDGVVRYFDGQPGAMTSPAGYSRLWLLPTN